MVRRALIVLVTLMAASVAVMAIALGVWLWNFLGPGGFMEGKSNFSYLQGLELRHRHDSLRTPDLFETQGKLGPVIVVATFDPAFPYAWIAAAISDCDGEVCMVDGDTKIDITCDDLGRLASRVPLAPRVAQMLKNACHASQGVVQRRRFVWALIAGSRERNASTLATPRSASAGR